MSTTRPESPSVSPAALLRSLLENRGLISALVKREIAARYRGSALGFLWSVLNPLMILAVYAVVFSTMFKQAEVPGEHKSDASFALVLFSGLLIYNLFVECVNRAPSLIQANTNYVKKVVFPLEILSVVAMGSALFQLGISLVVWFVFFGIAIGMPSPHLLLLPFVLLPFILFSLGVTWFLAALGVFIKDVGQFVGVVLMVMMFLSPIFYRLENVEIDHPEFAAGLALNPVTICIEQARDLMWHARFPDLMLFVVFCAASLLIAWLGLAFFQKTRRGFADVL